MLCMAMTLAMSIVALPARRALAEGQVLELPAAASTSPATAAFDSPQRGAAATRDQLAEAAPPPGVGSIDDYMNQGEGNSAAGRAQRGFSYPTDPTARGFSSPANPTANRNALYTEAAIGVLALGLYALEMEHSAHQHRHHRRY